MESQGFDIFAHNLQRSINCLTDQDRNIRKEGLSTLMRQFSKSPKDYHQRLFENSHLGRNLMHTLRDPIENNRELTLNLLELVIKTGTNLRKQQTDLIIKDLVARIGGHPFPEKSEDLRQKIIVLLKTCLQFKDSFTINLADISTALGLCLGDQSGHIKSCACDLINDIAKECRNTIGKYSQGLTKALSQNLKNNKYQIRKATLTTVSRLLVTEGAGGNFEHIQVALKTSLTDSKAEVRKTALQSVAFLLKYMAPKFLKQYESHLVAFLLSGLSDQSQANVDLCKKLLEECGQSLRELEGEELISEEKE